EKDETKFFKINIHGGEAQHLFTIDKKVGGLKKSESGIFANVWKKVGDENDSQSKENEEGEEEKEQLEEGED
ncbi:MAG: hypothetical protein V5A66_02380, partial [Candidatus Thermoplasmatota archaeon]